MQSTQHTFKHYLGGHENIESKTLDILPNSATCKAHNVTKTCTQY